MEKITEIDKKILYELILDARQSISRIAKKLRQSKNVVNYRIQRLEQLGIITNYYTIIDSFKIGYKGIRFYTKFQYTSPDATQQIIHHFTKEKQVGAIYSLLGAYDLDVIYWITSLKKFHISWNKTLKQFCKYFHKPTFSLLYQVIYFDPLYLLTQKPHKHERKTIELNAFDTPVEIDDIEMNILHLIAAHARLSTTAIARHLGITEEIVRYRIKKLIKTGVIKGFTTNIDISKIGYEWIAVQLYLSEYQDRTKILKYFETNPYFVGFDASMGYAHLELEFHVRNIDHLIEIIQDLLSTFPQSIKSYTYFKPRIIHKLQYMPEQ